MRLRWRRHRGEAIARRVRSYEAALEKLRDSPRDPGTVLFEHLGVDFVAVDEAHMFKRLPIDSRAEGFSFGASKRATDLLLKMRLLASRNEGRPHAALFTGTPWTNSLAETFVWQTYLQPEVLDAAGVSSFDAWAAAFLRRETQVEVAPDGSGFRLATRPVALINVPELRTMLAQNADILPPNAIPLDRPDAVCDTVVTQPHPDQTSFIRGLVDRADAIRGKQDQSAEIELELLRLKPKEIRDRIRRVSTRWRSSLAGGRRPRCDSESMDRASPRWRSPTFHRREDG